MLKKTGRILAAAIVSIMLMACAKPVDKVQTPADNRLERGRNYKEVIEDFEDKGFANIRTEPIADQVYGRSIRDGEVDHISVGGDINYDSGVLVPADTEVVIYYHTYSKKSIEEAAAKEAEKAKEKEENTSEDQYKDSKDGSSKDKDSEDGNSKDSKDKDSKDKKSKE